MPPTLPTLALPSPYMPTPTTAEYGKNLRASNGTPVQANLIAALDAITAVAEKQIAETAAAADAAASAATPADGKQHNGATPGGSRKRVGTPATNAGGRLLSAAKGSLSKIKERMTPKSTIKTPAAKPAGEQAVQAWLESAGLGKVHGLLDALMTAAADLDGLKSLTDDEVACAISPLKLKATGIKYKKLLSALAVLRGDSPSEANPVFMPKGFHEAEWVNGNLEVPLVAPLDLESSVTRVNMQDMPPPMRPRIGDLRMPVNPNPPKHKSRVDESAPAEKGGAVWRVNQTTAEANELAELATLLGGNGGTSTSAAGSHSSAQGNNGQVSMRPDHSEAAARAAMMATKFARDAANERRRSFVSSAEIMFEMHDEEDETWLHNGVPLPAPKFGGASKKSGGGGGGLSIDESLLQMDLLMSLDEAAEAGVDTEAALFAKVQEDLEADKENRDPGHLLNRQVTVAAGQEGQTIAGGGKKAKNGAKSARFGKGEKKAKKGGSKTARDGAKSARAASSEKRRPLTERGGSKSARMTSEADGGDKVGKSAGRSKSAPRMGRRLSTEDKACAGANRKMKFTEDMPVAGLRKAPKFSEEMPVAGEKKKGKFSEDKPVAGTRKPLKYAEDKPVAGERKGTKFSEETHVAGERKPLKLSEDKPVAGERKPLKYSEDTQVAGERKGLKYSEETVVAGEKKGLKYSEDTQVAGEKKGLKYAEETQVAGENKGLKYAEDKPVAGERKGLKYTEDTQVAGENKGLKYAEDKPVAGERKGLKYSENTVVAGENKGLKYTENKPVAGERKGLKYAEEKPCAGERKPLMKLKDSNTQCIGDKANKVVDKENLPLPAEKKGVVAFMDKIAKAGHEVGAHIESIVAHPSRSMVAAPKAMKQAGGRLMKMR